jgi:hypothetical protein
VAKQISFESIISFINLEFKGTEMKYYKKFAWITSALLCAMLSFSANAQVTGSGLEPKCPLNGEVIRTRENSYWHQPLEMNFDSETMPEWFGLPDPKDKAGHFKIGYVRVWQKE